MTPAWHCWKHRFDSGPPLLFPTGLVHTMTSIISLTVITPYDLHCISCLPNLTNLWSSYLNPSLMHVYYSINLIICQPPVNINRIFTNASTILYHFQLSLAGTSNGLLHRSFSSGKAQKWQDPLHLNNWTSVLNYPRFLNSNLTKVLYRKTTGQPGLTLPCHGLHHPG